MFLFASCQEDYDDTALWDAVNNHEERLAALEQWQQETNHNIAAIQQLLNTTDCITAITPLMEGGKEVGYTITFLHSDPIIIYHGKKGDKGDKGEQGDTGDKGEQGDKGDTGADGHTPLIGLTQEADGNWYWTLDGQLMTDPQGNPICANGEDGKDGQDGTDGEDGQDGQDGTDGQPGADGEDGTPAPTPQISLGSSLTTGTIMTDNGTKQADAWYLSVDGGQTWYRISGEDGEDGNRGPTGPQGPTGPAGATGQPGDSMFSQAPKLSDDGTHWTFYPKDGTPFKVPAYQALTFSDEPGTSEGTQWVTAGAESIINLSYNPDGYTALVAQITPVGAGGTYTDISTRTDNAGGWSVKPDLAAKTVTVTAPATAGKALLDVSLIRADGSKQTASRVLEAVTKVYGGETLTEAGTYIMQGTYTQGITISGQGITLVLDGVNITTTNTSAISITGGANPTLRVVGENSVSAKLQGGTSDFAGIYVEANSSVTITGDGTGNVLRATSQNDAGIGGYGEISCGDITITGITVEAVGGFGSRSAPGIGSVKAECGTITITDAVVRARGYGASTSAAPAIGAYGSVPNIVIRNSEIHAYRGYRLKELNPDYIGLGVVGMSAQGSGLIQGDIKSSTVYKYTYDWETDTSTEDGIVDYDDQGIGTERPRP